jgi:hypothetical protein
MNGGFSVPPVIARMPITEASKFKRQVEVRGHLELAEAIDLLTDLTDDGLAAWEDDEWDRIATRRFARIGRECEWVGNHGHNLACG